MIHSNLYNKDLINSEILSLDQIANFSRFNNHNGSNITPANLQKISNRANENIKDKGIKIVLSKENDTDTLRNEIQHEKAIVTCIPDSIYYKYFSRKKREPPCLKTNETPNEQLGSYIAHCICICPFSDTKIFIIDPNCQFSDENEKFTEINLNENFEYNGIKPIKMDLENFISDIYLAREDTLEPKIRLIVIMEISISEKRKQNKIKQVKFEN